MQTNIFILITSLRYEPAPDRVQEITRSQLNRIRQESKSGKGYHDLLIQRITESKFYKEQERIDRENFRNQYDQAIMKKYNVNKDYRHNRYFMEQIRPTL